MSILTDLLNDEETPATLLNCLILKTYGSQCYNWEFETLWMQLMEDYGVVLSDFTKHKISAVISLNTSTQFYDNWESFENICQAFNDNDVHFEDMTPLTAEELTWGVIEAMLNDDFEGVFSADVLAYIESIFKKDGVSTCPEFISHKVKYRSLNEFDNKQEAVYQARIRAYVMVRLEKIIRLSREYFLKNPAAELSEEIPGLSKYLGQSLD